MSTEPSNQVVEIAQKVFELLTQGKRTNTYKYATLLGILDTLEECCTADGPPSMITSRQLAERVLRIYWPQCDDPRVQINSIQPHLLQQSGAVPYIISEIQKQRSKHPNQTVAQYLAQNRSTENNLRGARQVPPVDSLMKNVESTLVRNPIPRLQKFNVSHRTVDGQQTQKQFNNFLYLWDWPADAVPPKDYFDGNNSAFDNRLKFLPGVAECLLTLAPLIRPMVHREWTTFITQIEANRIETDKVFEFLFVRQREQLGPVRKPLLELQQGRCFYCGAPMNAAGGHVDHFIPWSRHPNNAIENLVVAHSTCNSSKSDFFAAPKHLQSWKERLRSPGIAQVARELKWDSRRSASISIVQSIYSRLSPGIMVWNSKADMIDFDVEHTKPLLKELDALRNSAA
jgi:hypothetical protein